MEFPATVKWGKQRFTGMILYPGMSADELQQKLQSLTGVPVLRQKVMCNGAWKGMLKTNCVINSLALPAGQSEFIIMLIGSAEAALQAPTEPTIVSEDYPELATAAAAAAEAAAIAAAEGAIPALQMKPGQRDDGKKEAYKYNHFVTGLPQRQIETMLRRRREGGFSLLGECAMTFGTELGPSYVTALACLQDGKLVSGHDNGRVQLWLHCVRWREVEHDRHGSVTCVQALSMETTGLAFATAGSGLIKLFSAEGDCVRALASPPGATPAYLAVSDSFLAVVNLQALPFNTNEFRLVPTNEEQRRRRAEAEAARSQAQATFASLAKSVQLVPFADDMQSADVESTWLACPEMGPLVALAAMPSDAVHLACADVAGALHLWRRRGHAWTRHSALQVCVQANEGYHGVGVVCMHPLSSTMSSTLLAVSLQPAAAIAPASAVISKVTVPRSRGVLVVDLESKSVLVMLDAHADIVTCMTLTPDGGLATAGGKRDASVRLWPRSCWHRSAATQSPGAPATSAAELRLSELGISEQLGEHARHATHIGHNADFSLPPLPSGDAIAPLDASSASSSHGHDSGDVVVVGEEVARTVKDAGYVFALASLPDAHPSSPLFALAAARYNSVKLLL